MIIVIFILIAICGVLIYQLSQKKQVDDEIRQQNEELNKVKQKLELNVIHLKADKNALIADCKTLKDTIDSEYNHINKIKQQNETIANEAYSNYVKNLEEAYTDAENEFDIKIANKNLDLLKVQKELDKLKETRAAAHEALLKEQEVKENKDNYRLLPSQADLNDARRLEVVKRELNKPRILSMLIWQTYWQPIAKKQFPQILQDKTKCGIYKITNIVTDECYIGQSVDIYKRWNEHCKCGLGIDTPPGNKLYKSIQEYGLENFTFELLTTCNQTELNEKERYFIELYQADTFGFNSTGGNK